MNVVLIIACIMLIIGDIALCSTLFKKKEGKKNAKTNRRRNRNATNRKSVSSMQEDIHTGTNAHL